MNTWISEVEFGLEMLCYETNEIYPLEAVSSLKLEDEHGVFYVPQINSYTTDESFITGAAIGYPNREELLRCIGRCWDAADSFVKTNNFGMPKKEG